MHISLPAAPWGEKDGTVSDLQQRIWDRYELALYALLRPDPGQPDLDLDDDQLDLFIPEDEIPI